MTEHDGFARRLGCREQRVDALDTFCDFLNFFPEVQTCDPSVDEDDTTLWLWSSVPLAPETGALLINVRYFHKKC